ncbi:MAG TPA: crossover junction endodeoxyribonuclease RuvC [Pyrinomonadaceae bacterium]
MNLDRLRVLAIDPGTKQLGVAVLEGNDLIYYAVKTIHDRSTSLKVLQQIAELTRTLIGTYGPDYLAIERTFLIQRSAALLSVATAEIKSVARAFKLPIYEYKPSTIRRFICDSDTAKKRDVAIAIGQRFPELSRHLRTLNRWDEIYYANIFDAVGVGLMCQHELAVGPNVMNEEIRKWESRGKQAA